MTIKTYNVNNVTTQYCNDNKLKITTNFIIQWNKKRQLQLNKKNRKALTTIKIHTNKITLITNDIVNHNS